MFVLLLTVVVVLLYFSMVFRGRVAGLITGVSYTFAGVANLLWPRFVGMLLLLMFAWAALVVIVGLIGIYAHAVFAAIFIGLLFPIWFFTFILSPLRRLPIAGATIGRIFFVSNLIITPVLLVSLIYFGIGVWSPEVKISIDRWTGNKKIEVANGMDKDSLQSEPEAGIFAIVTKDIIALDESGNPLFKVEANTAVKIYDLNGKKATADAEGKIRVMVPNSYGHYDRGRSGWLPTRVLEWNTKPHSKKDPPEPVAWANKSNNGAANEIWGRYRVTGIPPGDYCQHPAGETVYVFSSAHRFDEFQYLGNEDIHIPENVSFIKTTHPRVELISGKCKEVKK